MLQSLTLLVAITGRPATPEAAAAQYRASQSDEGRGNTLPNAADQRLQQIRLLGQIKEELTRANQKLEQIHTAVKDEDEQAPPQQ